MSAIETVTLPRVGILKMGETIIEKDCTGEGLPIYSADKSNRPWAFSTHFKRLNKRGTIVLGARGTIGYPRLPRDEEFGATQTTITLTPDSDTFHPEFVYFALQQLDFTLLGAQQAIPMLTVGNLESVTIPKFSKPEQTKIAEILSTVDRAIEQTEALIAKQQRLKTGLMADLLSRGIDEHGNLRSEQTHEFKDSPLGRIPVEWEVVSLFHYVARLVAGVSVNADDSPCGAGQVGVLKTSALSKGRFLPQQNKSVIRDDLSRVRTSLRANTVLVSRMNTPALVGESAFIDRDYPELFLPDRIWMTVFQDEKESAARWIGFILTSPRARNHISLNATGTSGSMKNLSKKSLLTMPIASPDTLEEVNRVTQVLVKFEMDGKECASQLSKLRSLKTALMQDLLTGRKRVTDLI